MYLAWESTYIVFPAIMLKLYRFGERFSSVDTFVLRLVTPWAFLLGHALFLWPAACSEVHMSSTSNKYEKPSILQE